MRNLEQKKILIKCLQSNHYRKTTSTTGIENNENLLLKNVIGKNVPNEWKLEWIQTGSNGFAADEKESRKDSLKFKSANLKGDG